jgi:hypothetical protein
MDTVGGFLINLISGGLVGIIASYAASYFFLQNNNKHHRPIIELSDKLIQSQRDNGTPAFLVKIINKTDKDIADVVFEMEGVNNKAPKGSIPLYILHLLCRRDILFVQHFDKNDTDAHYAHRINLFQENKNIHETVMDYEYIRISVRAVCPFYGTSAVIFQDYNVKNDILNSDFHFNTGNSFSVSSK